MIYFIITPVATYTGESIRWASPHVSVRKNATGLY